MNIVIPYTSSLSDANGNSIEYFNTLISTNVTDQNLNEHDSSTTYALNDVVKIGALKRWYTSNTDNNTDYPFGSAKWVDMGALNSYACFDKQLNTVSKASRDMVIEIDTSRATKLALLNLTNVTSVTIEVTDTNDNTATSDTVELRDYGVNSLYDYAYKPFRDKTELFYTLEWLPASKTKITIPYANADIEVGAIVTGVEEDTGVTLYNTTVGFKDFSQVNTDTWGNTTFVPRNVASIIDADIVINTVAVDSVLDTFKDARARLSLFIGDERDTGFESLNTLGFVRNVRIPLTPVKSQYSISIIGVI